MIPTLTRQVEAAAPAIEALRDAEHMIARLNIWDAMFPEEKEAEFNKGAASAFFEVPGFQPRWCANCAHDQWFDYRDDPEGACMTCGAWDGQKQSEPRAA
jgi:hypothetical protein